MTLDDINREPIVYLLPECESDEEFAEWVDGHFDDIFQEQLAGWWTDESLWPVDRTAELFRQYFDCRFYSVVLDPAPGRLSHVS